MEAIATTLGLNVPGLIWHAINFVVLLVLLRLVLYKPAQLSALAWMFGGFHLTRVWHFIAMCGFLAFLPGHLLMVALHGWNNFMSMLTEWNAKPEYVGSDEPDGPV